MRYFPLARGFAIYSGFRTPDRPDHWGVDFGKDGGSGGLPVFACQGGTVANAGPASGFGQWVCLDHPDSDGGGFTVYGHTIPEVAVGQRVEAGQRIARINPDSNTNGGVPPHVHVELHRSVWSPPGPNRLDPLPWLGQAAYPAEQPTGGTVSAQLVVTPGLGGNPNGSQLVDVGGALPNSVIRDAGYRGRAWYLARPNGSYGNGNATAARLLEAQGMGHDMYLNYERDAPTWMTEGWQAGVDAGHWIVDRVAELRAGGVQGIRVVALSADAHMSGGDLDQVVACLRGAQSVAGPLARGIYGFVETMDRIHAEGLADFYWQCGSKADLRPWVQMYQRNNDNDTIGGVAVDCNDVMAADYGQIDTRTPAATPTATPGVDVTPDECRQAIRDVLNEQAPTRVPGSTVTLGLGDCIRNADAAAFIAQHALTDPIPSAVPGSTYSAPPTAYWANADSYGYQLAQQVPQLVAAVQALEAKFAGAGTTTVPAGDVAAELRSVLAALTLTAKVA